MYKLAQLINIQKLRNLMGAFYLVTGIPIGMIDAEGNLVSKHGWQDICLKFHRRDARSKRLCDESNKEMQHRFDLNKGYECYQCKLGLMSAVAPLIIDGYYLGTIIEGQFFFEKPDEEYFINQAKKWGFNKKEYLAALKKVPVISRERVEVTMNLIRDLSHILGEMGLATLRQKEHDAMRIKTYERRLYTIMNHTPNIGIQSFDEQGKILYWNSASEKLFGWTYKEVLGKTLNDIFDKDTADKLNSFINQVSATDTAGMTFEWVCVTRKGTNKVMLSTFFPIRSFFDANEFLCIDVDITEQRRLQEEIIRLDKLNMVGEMAASIGHEIRNPMTTVRGFLQILKGKEVFAHYVDTFSLMIDELDRANSIIKEFLDLAKNKAISLEKNSLNDIIMALTPLLQASAIINGHSVVLELDRAIPHIMCDEKEIRQLVLNLVKNGFESMECGKILTIKTFKAANDVVLAVEDQGRGIAEEIQSKIGIPFFTTKDTGTGLGLAVCYSIAARHGAKLFFETSPAGTNFYLRFSKKSRPVISNWQDSGR